MSNYQQESGYPVTTAGAVFAGLGGLLMGGLIGAGAMLLLAPRSGKKTWAKVQREGQGLRDQVTETVEDTVAQARSQARRIMAGVHKQSAELQERGQDMLDDQKKIVSKVVEAEKTAVHDIASN